MITAGEMACFVDCPKQNATTPDILKFDARQAEFNLGVHQGHECVHDGAPCVEPLAVLQPPKLPH